MKKFGNVLLFVLVIASICTPLDAQNSKKFSVLVRDMSMLSFRAIQAAIPEVQRHLLLTDYTITVTDEGDTISVTFHNENSKNNNNIAYGWNVSLDKNTLKIIGSFGIR